MTGQPMDDGDPFQDDGPLVLWWLAVVGAVAAFLARALAPALRGVWVGTDRAISWVEGGAGIASQLFAVSAAAVAVGMTSAVLRSGLAWRIKVAATLGGGLTVFAVMLASAARLHRLLVFIYGTAAVVAAFRVARDAARHRSLRAGALVVGMMSAAGMARLLAMVALGVQARAGSSGLAPILVDVTATLSFGFEVLAIVVAMAWLASSSFRPRMVVGLTAAFSLAGYTLVQLASMAETSGAGILLSRLIQAMLVGPPPAIGHGLRVVLEIVTWVVLFGVLSCGPRGRFVSGCIALSLVARAAPERPLCALALFVAALGLALDRHSPSAELSILESDDDSLLKTST